MKLPEPGDGPAFTRICPDCGWTNGAYFPQPGMEVPEDGAQVDGWFGDCCLECRKGGHMVWKKL